MGTRIKEWFNRNQTEIVLSTCLALFIPIWIGLAPIWYDWYGKDGNGILFKRLYGVLNNCLCINVPICIVIFYVFICWWIKIYKDQDFRFYRLIFSILGIVFLILEKSRVIYAKISDHYDYRDFLCILFALTIIITLSCKIITLLCKIYDCWKIYREKNKKAEWFDNQIKGFSDDNISKGNIPEKLKNYAQVIVGRLLKTDITEKSFALGVTGEWGVGKTTFLRELKEQFEGHADIVEFNPWMCSSPEQVTNDFFASLRHQLSSRYSSLSNPIKEYSQYIKSLNISSQSWASLKLLLPVKQESLFKKKKTLSQRFAMLPRPVVVVMDDIDRLERDEVFEVLRLIRNTADLNNMIYIVAYDKEYVTCVLEEKNIKDSSAYLEKIFPVEVHLPKVEDHLIWDALRSEIEAQNILKGDFDFASELFNMFNSDDKELILRILDNYRRAKRFAGLYMLNMTYIFQYSREELKYTDVFWLELLQIYDKKSYDVLANEKNVLFYYDGYRFRIRKGILNQAKEKDEYTFKGSPFWKAETPMILNKLFGDHIKKIKQSVCYAENYDKYFTLSVSPFKLSIREMNELLNAKEDHNVIVKKWVDGGKYFNSIVFQFKQIVVYKLRETQLNAYIKGILCFAILIYGQRNYFFYLRDVKKMLRKENFTDELKKKIHDIVMGWINEKINDPKELLDLGGLLHNLYEPIYYDENEEKETVHELVISNDEIEKLLINVMEKYLDANSELTALEVLSEKSNLARMFKNCCVNVSYNSNDIYSCEYKQLAYDVVIRHFASKEDKPTIEEYKKVYDMLFNDTPEDEDEYYEYRYQNEQAYFGSSNDSKDNNKLEEFKDKCFVMERAEKNEDHTT